MGVELTEHGALGLDGWPDTNWYVARPIFRARWRIPRVARVSDAHAHATQAGAETRRPSESARRTAKAEDAGVLLR